MYLVNVSIDDVSPHPQSSTKVLERCRELINVYPDIKFTLFIPAAYWRTKSQITEKPLYLNEFPDFCKEISDLDQNNFEIGYHGFYHGIPNVSNNDEFRYASYEQTVDIITKENKRGILCSPRDRSYLARSVWFRRHIGSHRQLLCQCWRRAGMHLTRLFAQASCCILLSRI